MFLEVLLVEKGMTVYRLSKESDVPYMTVNDLVNDNTPLSKAKLSTIVSLCDVLGISIDYLVNGEHKCFLAQNRNNTPDLFSSNTLHELKRLGDLSFIKKTLQTKAIEKYFHQHLLFEGRYLLALTDYLCRINKLPVPSEYQKLRQYKLKKLLFLGGALDETEEKALIACAIPEFLQANIVEGDIRNVA